MRFIPHSDGDIKCMLETIGISSIDELFDTIPKNFILNRKLNLPGPMSEMELVEHVRAIADSVKAAKMPGFLGAGIYNHFRPAAIAHLLSRQEFYSCYTPYQPEMSQGTLQAVFEFQTFMCLLNGMDVSNASMYDGASAAAEVALMAIRADKAKRVLVSRAVHPQYRKTIRTYLAEIDIEICELELEPVQGTTSIEDVASKLGSVPSIVILQSPNYFGCVEHVEKISVEVEKAGKGNSLAVAIAEPLSLALFKPPGETGASIACGEAQSFGLPMSMGGPGVGFIAAKKKYLRSLPGRIVGETVDNQDRRSYCLTLATREQHIRREKATSNICTNQGLCALAATIYLSLLGKTGLKKLATLNLKLARHTLKRLTESGAGEARFKGATFNEFTLKTKTKPSELIQRGLDENILVGVELGNDYPELEDSLLIAVTEMNSDKNIDKLANVIG